MPRDRKAPTQRDVAVRAGVSTATVSYILSGRRDRANPVTGETRDRVVRAAEALGYQRNHAARSLRRRRTEFVCVVYRPPSSPWVEGLAEQLRAAAVPHGYSVITLPIAPGDRVDSGLRVLREHYVDGAVITPNYSFPSSELASLARNGPGLVVFDDEVAPDGFDVVRLGQAAACYAAVDHLASQGHRRIGYFGHGDYGQPPEPDIRYATYRRVLADRDLPHDPSLAVAAADSRSAAYLAATDLFRRPDRPTALFSATDRGAIAAIWAATQVGLSVPADVAVVGFGNTDEGAVISPTLTSAGLPSFDFTPIIDRLFARITQEPAPPDTELHQPWELVIRDSS